MNMLIAPTQCFHFNLTGLFIRQSQKTHMHIQWRYGCFPTSTEVDNRIGHAPQTTVKLRSIYDIHVL